MRRKANWIGHILHRNCFLKHVIEGKDRSDGKMRKKTSRYRMTLRKQEDTGN